MRYVAFAVALLADAIELDRAVTAYCKRAEEDLHTLPKAALLTQENERTVADAIRVCQQNAQHFLGPIYDQAMREIELRKCERERARKLALRRATNQPGDHWRADADLHLIAA